MSNTPFDDDDDFGFDDFDFDDNELDAGGDEGFDFGDDEFDLSPEDEFDFGDDDFDLGGDDDFEFTDDAADTGGPSRTFIYIAGAMIGLFVIALIALVLIALGGDQTTDIDLTTTAIVQLNATTEAQLRQTQTQAVFFRPDADTVGKFDGYRVGAAHHHTHTDGHLHAHIGCDAGSRAGADPKRGHDDSAGA